MKRLLIVLAVMLAMCLTLVSSFSAAQCGRQKVNVISGSSIVVETDDTDVTNYLGNLTDGDKSTGVKSSTKDSTMSIKIEFPGSGELLEDIIITVSSPDSSGVASGATGLGNRAFGAEIAITVYPVDATEPYEVAKFKPATTQKEVKVDLSSFQKTVRMIEIQVYCNNSANHPIWEIEANKYEGNHAWELQKVNTPANCLTAGEGEYKCSCGETKTDIIPVSQHSFSWVRESDRHYKKCSVCQTIEGEGAHEYDHDCDTSCNVCFMPRTVEPHTYRADCATVCEKCGEAPRTPINPSHTYYRDSACDEFCDLCFEQRTTTVDHVWDNACDSRCDNCNGTREVPPHVYTNDAPCDVNCDICGAPRVVSQAHKYTNGAECDEYCDNCNTKRINAAEHKFPNPCAPRCRDCGYERTSETDPEYTGEHQYDNPCDPDCNHCSEKRSVAHEYDNPCDGECNKCGGQRTPSKHNFVETSKIEPTEDSEGLYTYVCLSCNKTERRIIAMLPPAPKTPIILVSVAIAVVIVGCVAIAIIFMVIKPRMEAEKKAIADYLKKEEEQRKLEEKQREEQARIDAREALAHAFGGSVYDDSDEDDSYTFAGIGDSTGTDDGNPMDGLNDDPSDDFVSNPDENDEDEEPTGE